MTIRYVGPGGSDSNDGLSWATRKLTISGAEATPVVAGDTVYVGPGVYRETFAASVSGTVGNIITYIGDVDGSHTDGIGGVVRISSLNSDEVTNARTVCISANDVDYRTFRGFYLEFAGASYNAAFNGPNYPPGVLHLVIEDCIFQVFGNTSRGFFIADNNAYNHVVDIRRCVFLKGGTESCIMVMNSTSSKSITLTVEDCLFIAPDGTGVYLAYYDGTVVKNCTFLTYTGVNFDQTTTPNSSFVYNSLFYGNNTALITAITGVMVEDYNNLAGCNIARQNVSVGANSVSLPIWFAPPALLNGFVFAPQLFGSLASWSPMIRRAGNSQSTFDLLGMTRPATDSKRSWGAVQYQGGERSTTQAQAGTASFKLPDAGRKQFIVPTTNVSTTISCYVYREADYTGTLPQMVIKQPGQADTTVTDTGAAGGWNQLTTTLTPAASPGFVIVEVVSNNTASSGSYNLYVDSLAVS